MSFTLPKMLQPPAFPDPPPPTRAEFELVATTAANLADKLYATQQELLAANRELARLRAGDRSTVKRALLRERDVLQQQLYDLDERNAGLCRENETLTRERDDALAHLGRHAGSGAS